MSAPGEFYRPAAEHDLGDPAADPVLTVRMQPPNDQARRLDLAVPRAVKLDENMWSLTGDRPLRVRLRGDDEVATWPIVSAVTIGAAQRLAAGRTTGSTGPAPALPSDEDERPFR